VSQHPDPQSIDAADWALAKRRAVVIRPLVALKVLTAETVDRAAGELGLSRSLTYRLIARYREQPQLTSLLPRKRGRGSSPTLEDDSEALIQAVIREVYLTAERPSFAALMRAIRTRAMEEGLPVPHYRTVHRRVEALDPRMVVARRMGAAAARQQFGPVHASPFERLLPLSLMQIDHTRVDLILVDERERLPIGRPWLTLAIDVASRVVAGFSVSFEAPSALSVAFALVHATGSKDLWLADRGLDLVWPVSGIPDRVHVDNAPEFDSRALLRGAEEHGIEIMHRPPYHPSAAGHVERLIGTLMRAVHALPGTTFSNVAMKGTYPSEAQATLTLAEFERWLALEITGEYHHRVHAALGVPPLVAWQEGLARRTEPPRTVSDADRFFMDFLPGEWRTVRRDGIRLFNLYYWHNVLSPIAGRSTDQYLVKYNPRDLSRVFVQDPTTHDY
jgi:putative transposase